MVEINISIYSSVAKLILFRETCTCFFFFFIFSTPFLKITRNNEHIMELFTTFVTPKRKMEQVPVP